MYCLILSKKHAPHFTITTLFVYSIDRINLKGVLWGCFMKKLLFYTLVFTNIIRPDDTTIFAHGIVDNCQQINRFKDAISTTKTQSISFPDSLSPSDYNPITIFVFSITQHLGKNMNYSSMFMGQKDDIRVIEKQVLSTNPEDQIILYGCSRGAATIHFLSWAT